MAFVYGYSIDCMPDAFLLQIIKYKKGKSFWAMKQLNKYSNNISSINREALPDHDISSQTWSVKTNPHSNVFRLLNEAAYLPYCSYNKQAQLRRPREVALQYPYMQVNRKDMVSWLVFDLDHTNIFVWEDEMLPVPNMIVKNPKSGTSHLFYAINPVCTSKNALAHPIQYMKAIVDALKLRLDADPSYSGPVAKTPGHPFWKTIEFHTKTYSLGELAESLELSPLPPWAQKTIEDNSHSRTLQLFDQTRYFAYSIVRKERKFGTFESFYKKVSNYANSKNNFKAMGYSLNLSIAEINSTVKSIARWTWDKYHGSARCNIGVMDLDKTLPLKQRQKLSAIRTKESVTRRSISKIQLAYKILEKKGIPTTQINLAKQSGLTRQTIAKYQTIIQKEKSEKTIKFSKLIKTINVKSGTYKITRPWVDSFSNVELDNSIGLTTKYLIKPVPPD